MLGIRLRTSIDDMSDDYKKKFLAHFDDEVLKLKDELEKVASYVAAITGEKEFSNKCREIEDNPDSFEKTDLDDCQEVKKKISEAIDYLIEFSRAPIHTNVKSPNDV